MLLRGDWVSKSGYLIHKLQAMTNKDKGKDRQGWFMGKGRDGLWARARMGKDGQRWVTGTGKDGQG